MSKRANRSLALIHYSWNKLRHGLARSLFKPVFFVEKFMLCVCQPCSCRLVVSQSEIYFGNRFCCTFPVFTHSTNRRTSTSFLNVLITATWAPSKMSRKISVTLKSIICLYFEKTNSLRHTLRPNQAVVTSDQFWWKHQHSRWGFTHWCCSRFIWNLLFTIFLLFLQIVVSTVPVIVIFHFCRHRSEAVCSFSASPLAAVANFISLWPSWTHSQNHFAPPNVIVFISRM